MLSKEASIGVCVDHLVASARDDVRVSFSVGEDENFAYEMGVHIGSVIAKLFIDDPDQMGDCVHGIFDYTRFDTSGLEAE